MAKLKSFTPSGYINKYSISIVAFIIWVGVFDKYSWIKQVNVERKIHKLDNRKEVYLKMLKEAVQESKDIMEHKEKYVREKYFLYKEGEEVA